MVKPLLIHFLLYILCKVRGKGIENEELLCGRKIFFCNFARITWKVFGSRIPVALVRKFHAVFAFEWKSSFASLEELDNRANFIPNWYIWAFSIVALDLRLWSNQIPPPQWPIHNNVQSVKSIHQYFRFFGKKLSIWRV